MENGAKLAHVGPLITICFRNGSQFAQHTNVHEFAARSTVYLDFAVP